MTSITHVGLDVHTTNYTVCCYSIQDDQTFAIVQMEPDYKHILKYLNRVNSQHGGKLKFLCGYEAGCLGYSLYHELTCHGVDCVILAPSTMANTKGNQVKTDRRDAKNIAKRGYRVKPTSYKISRLATVKRSILSVLLTYHDNHIAKCLAYHLYSPVYVPTEQDNAVKEYIRMRDDGVEALKRMKQQIIALCIRSGKRYDGKSYWTKKHEDWLLKLELGNEILNETMREYLARFYQLSEKVEIYNLRIEEFSRIPEYEEKVRHLCCMNGIATHTAMCAIVEIGDFKRFSSAEKFSAFLGLVPGERSSGDKERRTRITKHGNAHLRRLLVEATQSYSRGAVGKKSGRLKKRQTGQPAEVVAYADKAAERLRRKFRKVASHANYNIAKTAVARELACFIWGMMTENYA